MRKIKGLKYSIDSENHFKGIPFFRKLRKVDFRISDKQVAELIIDRNQYKINFVNSDKMEIVCENKHGTEFKLSDLNSKRVYTFFNPNKGFPIFKQASDFLIKSNESEIEISNRNGSFIYTIEEKLIGRIEEKNMFIRKGNFRIDVFDEVQKKKLIGACCIELIRYHILKVYEPLDI